MTVKIINKYVRQLQMCDYLNDLEQFFEDAVFFRSAGSSCENNL